MVWLLQMRWVELMFDQRTFYANANALTSLLYRMRSSKLQHWTTVNSYLPLFAIHTHSRHKHYFPYVRCYCYFWNTVKTEGNDEDGKVKRDMRDRSGSQLGVSNTVSHHSDRWPSLLQSEETTILARHKLLPRQKAPLYPISHCAWSNQCYIITSVSATSSSDIFWRREAA